jgi:hypothetical protein
MLGGQARTKRFGRLAYAIHAPEKYSNIYAESVVFGSHARKTL